LIIHEQHDSSSYSTSTDANGNTVDSHGNIIKIRQPSKDQSILQQQQQQSSNSNGQNGLGQTIIHEESSTTEETHEDGDNSSSANGSGSNKLRPGYKDQPNSKPKTTGPVIRKPSADQHYVAPSKPAVVIRAPSKDSHYSGPAAHSASLDSFGGGRAHHKTNNIAHHEAVLNEEHNPVPQPHHTEHHKEHHNSVNVDVHVQA